MTPRSVQHMLSRRWQQPYPSAPVAPCPSCGGSGTLIRKGYAETRCLSCRGTGKVETDRVCAVCGAFVAHCVCKRPAADGVIGVSKAKRVTLRRAPTRRK